jgi:hypothetical protein
VKAIGFIVSACLSTFQRRHGVALVLDGDNRRIETLLT